MSGHEFPAALKRGTFDVQTAGAPTTIYETAQNNIIIIYMDTLSTVYNMIVSPSDESMYVYSSECIKGP